MTARAWELLAVPLRAARRAGLVWGLSLAALIVLTVAFYPAFRDEPELNNLIEGMPDALIDAFGLADFGTPAGFLRGNLYAVLVPLMLAVAGVLLMNGQTASDEDSGRMEAYLAQPVTRQAIFIGTFLVLACSKVLSLGTLDLMAPFHGDGSADGFSPVLAGASTYA